MHSHGETNVTVGAGSLPNVEAMTTNAANVNRARFIALAYSTLRLRREHHRDTRARGRFQGVVVFDSFTDYWRPFAVRGYSFLQTIRMHIGSGENMLISTGDLKREVTSSRNNDRCIHRRARSAGPLLPCTPISPPSDQNGRHGFADERACICSRLRMNRCI